MNPLGKSIVAPNPKTATSTRITKTNRAANLPELSEDVLSTLLESFLPPPGNDFQHDGIPISGWISTAIMFHSTWMRSRLGMRMKTRVKVRVNVRVNVRVRVE